MKKAFFACITVIFGITMACPAEFQVNTNTNNVQEFPAIATDAAGNFVVVWRSKHTGSRGTYGQRFSADGTPLGGEFQINTGSVGGRISSGPSVAMDTSGNFVVTWTGYIGGEEHIFARRYDAGGSPVTSEFAVSTNTHASYENSHIAPSVAMNPSGAFAIVWAVWHGDDGHNGTWAIYGRIYDNGGAPRGDEFQITQLPHGNRAKVAMDNTGDFVVVWRREGDSNNPPLGRRIAVRRYNSNGTPKSDTSYITQTYGWANTIAVGMNREGNHVVAYAWGDWRAPDIYAQRFDSAGNSQGSPFLINSTIMGSQFHPSVAMNDNDEFVVAWSMRGVSERQYKMGGIYGQRYKGDGTAIGGQFQISTYVLDEPKYPAIAIRDSGEFVTVWQRNGQDGDDYGIFGEIGPKKWCADFTGDSFVNAQDFAFLAEQWLQEGYSLQTDLTYDNKINALDLRALCDQWLMPCSNN